MSFKDYAFKALVPKVELPNYFKISSTSIAGATKIEAKFLEQTHVKQVAGTKPSVLDVLQAFENLKLDKFPKAALAAMEYMMLPGQWDLECRKADVEGFLLTLDVHHPTSGTKHWEKTLHVTALQLSQFVDVLDWVKQANRMEKAGPK